MLLTQEGYLFSACLTTGLSELRTAHVHNKGAFYSALFNLSVGAERLLKVIVIMEHMLNNNLAVPSKQQLKGYGHNIVELYDRVSSIAKSHGIVVPEQSTLDTINRELLRLLSDFAQTTRYHNLDALSASHLGQDPLKHWSEIIVSILNSDVPPRQRAKILSTASGIANAIDNNTMTLMHGLDQAPLSTEEALALPGLHDQAVKFAVYRIVTILSPIRDLISAVCQEAYGLGVAVRPFPQMQEFLEWLWNDRQYVLRKKKWP